MKSRLLAAFFAIVALITLWACGGGGGIEGTGAPAQGGLSFSITDAPACGFDAVHISIDRIRVNQSAEAADGDAGWFEVVLSPAKRVDLLSLTNGLLEDLGQTSLPAGNYAQMSLVLSANSSTSPLANSVTPTGGAETALTTPSAQQSGLKVNTSLIVTAGMVAKYAIDFDACKSIVKRGNSGQYNLKPVLSVIPVASSTGMQVSGFVDPSIAATSTTVSLQLGGVAVKSTIPDPTGKFLLYPVPVGTYALVVTAANRLTSVITSVPVFADTGTTLSTAGQPIELGSTTQREVTGTVSPATATVRAIQNLSGGLSIEAAWAPVDAATGTFAFALPVGAPTTSAFQIPPVGDFAPDPAIAGTYTIEAVSDGNTKSQVIDVTSAVGPLTISFP